VWDAVTGQQVGEALRGHEDEVMSVAFSSDGTRIVSGSYDKTIRVWDAATGQVNVGLTTPRRQREWISLGEEETQLYILWIPHSLRRHTFVSYPCKMVMAALPEVIVQFHNTAWGSNWTQIKW
jgi:WD40 repeat protein